MIIIQVINKLYDIEVISKDTRHELLRWEIFHLYIKFNWPRPMKCPWKFVSNNATVQFWRQTVFHWYIWYNNLAVVSMEVIQ